MVLARVRLRSDDEQARMEAAEREQAERLARQMQFQHPATGGLGADEEAAEVQAAAAAAQPQGPIVGRNDPCPCGSGKKYKQCHGRFA
jgi:preprotein translocase subunit SecA